MNLLHPELPQGFESWTQVLADWGVWRAFSEAKAPRCLREHPALAAPLIAQLGSALRDRLYYHRLREVAILQLQVTEPAYTTAGGEAYRVLNRTMQEAQDRFFAVYHQPETSRERITRHEAMRQAQSSWEQSRRELDSLVQQTRRQAARSYWNAQPLKEVPDTIFATVPAAAPPARLARIHPAWWGNFFGRIQFRFGQGHPAQGELLTALPQLRTAARRYKLSAVITDWRNAHNDDWGWYDQVYHWVLAPRAAKKAQALARWFNTRAPGYLTDPARRQSLDAQLIERLAQSDPWHLPATSSPPVMNPWTPGRN